MWDQGHVTNAVFTHNFCHNDDDDDDDNRALSVKQLRWSRPLTHQFHCYMEKTANK